MGSLSLTISDGEHEYIPMNKGRYVRNAYNLVLSGVCRSPQPIIMGYILRLCMDVYTQAL